MRAIAPALSAALTLVGAAALADPKPLFDGKTFTGWEGDTAKTWRIENGEIVGGSITAKQSRNEFLSTKESFGNFELMLEFKLTGDPKSGMINSGIQFRSERIPDHHEMIGYQADIGDPEWWGCLYDESRRKKVLAKSDMTKLAPVLNREGWNEYVIRCEGPRIQLWVNGVQTVDYTEEDKTIPQIGKIAVQVHGGGMAEARFRNITIKPL